MSWTYRRIWSNGGKLSKPFRLGHRFAPIWQFALVVLFLYPLNSLYGQSDGVDWPKFLGPTGDNKSSETKVDLDWSPSGPKILWTRPLGESYGIGTVSRGKYFQFDYRNGQAVLFCLDRETGKLVWQYAYDSNYVDTFNYSSGPRTSPVIDGNRVYILGVDGHLICLNRESGTLIWKLDTNKRFGVVQNFFGVGSTPVIYKDLLIVMVGGSPVADQSIPPSQLDRVSGDKSAIVAFDKATGDVRYAFSDELASYASPKLIERPDRDWCFMFLRGGLLAFDPKTGREDFHFPWRARILESVNASTPVVWDDYVFISETYGPGSALLRYRGHEAPEPVWTDLKNRRQKSMQTHWNTPIYHEGYLYGSSGRHTANAELRCIEATTGRVMWSMPDLTRSSLLYVKGYFVCLSEYGVVRLIRANPQRYELIREFEPSARLTVDEPPVKLLRYPAWAAPILSHGLMYVRGRDRLVCYDLRQR